MSDRGFSIQEICASRGITLNKPKQKENNQFMEADVTTNFDIVAIRILIGRVRDWGVLNWVWPIDRMDILSSTWQTLVNMTNPPIGPKE